MVSTASCAPCHKVNPSATISNRRPSSALWSARSMSRTKAFVVTLAPASRQTCAAAHSSGNPLLPRTPASEHAARWWPRESSWRPHRHVREDKGNESPRRLRRTTLNNRVDLPSVATQTLARLARDCPPAPLPHLPREVSTGASQTLRLSTSARKCGQLGNIQLDP